MSSNAILSDCEVENVPLPTLEQVNGSGKPQGAKEVHCTTHPTAKYDEKLGCWGCWWLKEAKKDSMEQNLKPRRRTCELPDCDKKFLPSSPAQKFCTKACRELWNTHYKGGRRLSVEVKQALMRRRMRSR